MKTLRDYTVSELATILKDLGEPAYRAKQIFKWLNLGVSSYDEMTDIPKSLREKLRPIYRVEPPMLAKRQISKDGTRKYLWQLADGNCVETVLMCYKHGYSVCVSTQVGCRMGCVFCASTKGGLVRNLTGGEILEEVIFVAKDAGVRISNIVLMGTGEPLDNMDNVLKFIELVNSEDGLNLGQRHISLSTSGLCDKIDLLADKKLQITLSVSLHAPFDDLRTEIMPVNRAYSLARLIESCDRYLKLTGRRISFEYSMIRGFNDTPACAQKLADLVGGTINHVNLIPLNSIDESPLKPSLPQDVERFKAILEKRGITTTVRRQLGYDIDASCGQLRRKYQQQKNGGVNT